MTYKLHKPNRVARNENNTENNEDKSLGIDMGALKC